MPRQSIIERLAEADRRIRGGAEDGFYPIVLGDDTPVRVRVSLRKLRELNTSTFDITPLGDTGPVRERHVDNRIRINIFQSIIVQFEFIVAQGRAALDQHMRGRASIVFKSGKGKLFGQRVATDKRTAFENQAFEPGLRQIRGSDEAVVPGTGNNNVVPISHYTCGAAALAALTGSGMTFI